MNKTAKIASACAACAAAAALGISVFSLNRKDSSDPTYSAVTEAPATKAEPTEPKAIPANWSDVYEYAPDNTGVTARAKALLRQNPDICGYIRISDTMVDYPVLKDPGSIEAGTPFYGAEAYKPNWFYLSHDLDASDKRSGTLYMDYRDRFGWDEDDQSENIIIYGHNMMDNSMFGSLRRYRQDYSFYEQSPFIELSSNYKDYDYVIFAFLITSGSYASTDFVYWNMEELDDKESFDSYVARCRRDAMVNTGIDVQYGDKLLTLSTCYANEDNSRFIVVARRLRDGEVSGDLSSVKHTDEYIKAHQPETEKTESSGQ
ncbi:MAG: class B sortase [Ruminococcus sp.]|nr:class B sortase [Ruminococcus sp.]